MTTGSLEALAVAPIAVLRTDAAGVVRVAEGGSLQDFAGAPIVGCSILERFPEGSSVGCAVRKAFAGESGSCEALAPARRLWHQVQCAPITAAGVVTGVTVVAIDVTARVLAFEDLRRQKHEQQAIFDTLPAIIFLKDKNNLILRVNRTAAASIGRTPGELEGRRIEEFFPENASKYYLDDLEVMNSGKPKLNIIEQYETAPGQMGWLRTDKTPYRDEAGNVIGVVLAATDVTAWKHAELERARIYEQLKELDEQKTRFFGNVSHELRTPITLVLALGERLAGAPELSASARRDAEVIVENARSLARQVNELLDSARLDARRVAPHYARVDLARLVRRTAGYFEVIAAERGITLCVAAPETLPAEAEPEELGRALTNLLSNALRHTPTDGTVACLLSAAPDERIRIVVDDSGPGIPEDSRDRVFDRFYQLNPEDTGGGGLGLGLAIVREIARRHRGDVTARASPLGGARFVIELPRAAPGDAVVRPWVDEATSDWETPAELGEQLRRVAVMNRARPAPAAVADGKPCVLVVEDNAEMNGYLQEILGKSCRVACAFDGEQGVELAWSQHPDAIITDVMMPRLGGDELVRRVRANPALDGVPILVLTARADEALRVRLLEGGAQDYLTKPFGADEVRARVGNLVAIKRVRDTLQEELSSRATDIEALARTLVAQRRELAVTAEAMRVARDQAERASEMKTSFQRLITHELATPLTAIKLGLELVRRGPAELAPIQVVALARCEGSANRLASLVEVLLEHASIESGRLRLEIAEVDLRELVAGVVEGLRPLAEAKSLVLALHVDHLPPLRTDARLVRLIVSNLVGNALKFTQRGAIDVTLDESGGAIHLSVKDTGPGIAAADCASVFEPFTQLGDVHKKHLPGVGLGLTLVREMTSALAGTIDLASEVGVGSTFVVTLRNLDPIPALPEP